jgi:hypothetical protein
MSKIGTTFPYSLFKIPELKLSIADIIRIILSLRHILSNERIRRIRIRKNDSRNDGYQK